MWTAEKTDHVNSICAALATSNSMSDLDIMLSQVEEETGYKKNFIYDIYCEIYVDDVDNDVIEAEHKKLSIWEDTIIPAYELDYERESNIYGWGC